jgi:hypothetical protein
MGDWARDYQPTPDAVTRNRLLNTVSELCDTLAALPRREDSVHFSVLGRRLLFLGEEGEDAIITYERLSDTTSSSETIMHQAMCNLCETQEDIIGPTTCLQVLCGCGFVR